MLGRLAWHDIFIIIALGCGITASTGMALLTTVGLGIHDVDGSISLQDTFQWGLMATNCVYLSCNTFVKLGLLGIYRHFTMLWYNHWWISAMQVLSIIFGLSGVLGVIFQCVPITSAWDPSIVGHCLNKPAFWYSNGAIMIGFDAIMYIMPMIFTWNLQLPRNQKIGLRLLFALAFLTIIASIKRLYLFNRVLTEGDSSYNNGNMLIWAAVENHLAICIACAPAIKVMLVKVLIPRIQNYYFSNRGRFSRRSTAVGSANSGKSSTLPRDSFIALTENSKSDSTLNSRSHTHFKPWTWILTSRSNPSSHNLDLESNNTTPISTVHISSANGNEVRPSSASTIDKEDDKIYVKKDFHKKETFLVSVGESVDVDLAADRHLEQEYINAFPSPGPEEMNGQRSYMNSVRLMRERHDRGLGNF
ncbi:hypothetical protein Vi05172_g7345 [Venturia inaequalis]|nr:hypothetical protein Vi05172_g7345 [Venturia inaequalis]